MVWRPQNSACSKTGLIPFATSARKLYALVDLLCVIHELWYGVAAPPGVRVGLLHFWPIYQVPWRFRGYRYASACTQLRHEKEHDAALDGWSVRLIPWKFLNQWNPSMSDHRTWDRVRYVVLVPCGSKIDHREVQCLSINSFGCFALKGCKKPFFKKQVSVGYHVNLSTESAGAEGRVTRRSFN